mgnify:CR=1 FL=1
MRKYLILCSVLMAAMILMPLTAMEKPKGAVAVDEKITESSDGGSSTHTSSSGTTHGGGGGSF